MFSTDKAANIVSVDTNPSSIKDLNNSTEHNTAIGATVKDVTMPPKYINIFIKLSSSVFLANATFFSKT